jgi:hypothetical protein
MWCISECSHPYWIWTQVHPCSICEYIILRVWVHPMLNLNLSSPMLNLRLHNWEFEFIHVEFESSSIWNLNLSSPMLNLRLHNWEFELTHVKFESSSTWDLNLSSPMLNLRVHNWEFEFTHVWIWESTDIEWIHVFTIVFYEHMFDQV